MVGTTAFQDAAEESVKAQPTLKIKALHLTQACFINSDEGCLEYFRVGEGGVRRISRSPNSTEPIISIFCIDFGREYLAHSVPWHAVQMVSYR